MKKIFAHTEDRIVDGVTRKVGEPFEHEEADALVANGFFAYVDPADAPDYVAPEKPGKKTGTPPPETPAENPADPPQEAPAG